MVHNYFCPKKPLKTDDSCSAEIDHEMQKSLRLLSSRLWMLSLNIIYLYFSLFSYIFKQLASIDQILRRDIKTSHGPAVVSSLKRPDLPNLRLIPVCLTLVQDAYRS